MPISKRPIINNNAIFNSNIVKKNVVLAKNNKILLKNIKVCLVPNCCFSGAIIKQLANAPIL